MHQVVHSQYQGWQGCFNPFLANVLILHLLKTPENLGVFRRLKQSLARNGLKQPLASVAI